MSGLSNEQAEKKLKEGWIKAWMMVEALAVTEDAVRSGLERHIISLESEKGIHIIRKDFKKVEKVKKPFEKVEVAYSGVVEIELLVKEYDRLVFIVMNYAPSAVEILEPKKITMDAGEAQGILNTISEMIHRFVGLTRGAIMVDAKKK